MTNKPTKPEQVKPLYHEVAAGCRVLTYEQYVAHILAKKGL